MIKAKKDMKNKRIINIVLDPMSLESDITYTFSLHAILDLHNINQNSNDIINSILEDIKPDKNEEVLMHVNGFGGTPLMELYLLFDVGQKILEKKGINVVRSLVGNYTTSLDMAGASFSITKLNEKITKHWDSAVHTAALRWKI